jgi:hypothetical protein
MASIRNPLRDGVAIVAPSGNVGWERAVALQTIGAIGGMSWERTAVYYRRLNEQVRARLPVGPEPIDLAVFDTTLLHADAAIEFAMAKEAPRPPAASSIMKWHRSC